VEVEAYALANLEAKAAEGRLAVEALWPDVRTFPADRFRGCFDFILAGYPCQPFSLSGRRKGTQDVRFIWPAIAGIVDAVRPEFIFLENVPSHLNKGFDVVAASLEAMDFVFAVGVLGAYEVGSGIEHGHRMFVLGQAAGRGGRKVLRLSEGSRRPGPSSPDTGGTSEILGEADGERFQGVGGQSVPPVGERGLRVAPQGVFQNGWEAKRYVEPGLGRAVDGSSCRVDRLRLLGNGVVPAQAEEAFRMLMQEFSPTEGSE
jgi:DNA (cytosine-5)-methyltransferase 1